MRVTTVIEAMALSALLVGTAAAGVKYVAVVETDVDAASGASAELNPAEVREITAELRRQATENLPRDKYSVMTSETVQSMGGAVLEECAEENCVVALGSRIGADYIVRGTVSKFQTMFTLGIELYETDNGTLVVTSEAVRSEKLVELLNKAATASGNMFRKFAETQNISASATLQTKTESEIVARKSESVKTKKRRLDYYIAPKYQFPVGTPVKWGGVNLEGGLVWGNGAFLGIDITFGEGGMVDRDNDPNSTIREENTGGGISLGNVYDFDNQLQFVYGGIAGCWQYNRSTMEAFYFFAPFVKLRYRFVELSFRGLLGSEYHDSTLDSFSYNHQLMLGLYFATNKRER